jgi:hypothetical protein
MDDCNGCCQASLLEFELKALGSAEFVIPSNTRVSLLLQKNVNTDCDYRKPPISPLKPKNYHTSLYTKPKVPPIGGTLWHNTPM